MWVGGRGSPSPDFGSVGSFHICPFRGPLALGPRGPYPLQVLAWGELWWAPWRLPPLASASLPWWRLALCLLHEQNLCAELGAEWSVSLRLCWKGWQSPLECSLPRETGRRAGDCPSAWPWHGRPSLGQAVFGPWGRRTLRGVENQVRGHLVQSTEQGGTW